MLGAAAALYVIPGCTSNPGAGLKSLAHGDMKNLTVDPQPEPAPQIAFTDAAGRTHTLNEFRGKAVILNFWATWCAPCVQEMPTLAKLATQMAGQPVAIVPISVDSATDVANAEAFMAKHAPLPFYSEPKYALAFAFKPPVAGLPTTLLIDPAGDVRGRVSGGADWSGEDARKVVEAIETPR